MHTGLNSHQGKLLAALSIATFALVAPATAFGADAVAAQALAKQNKCFNCHSVDKKKDGPAWKDVAAKYKGNKDAEAKLYAHLTTGAKAKFDDGHVEDHPVIKAKSPDDTKNLVSWLLSL
jgi:cytochrome c